MKCTGNSSSSHDVVDDLTASEMAETKRTQASFLDGMNAFDDFLQLVSNVEALPISESKHRIAKQMEGSSVDDDDTSFFSDDSEDEELLKKDGRPRIMLPARGVRRDHSGDLERLFQPKCTVKDETGSDPPLQDKNQVEVTSCRANRSKPSKSLSKTNTRVRRDPTSLSENCRRRCSSTNLDADQASSDQSADDNKAGRILTCHSAHEQSKSSERTGFRRGQRVPSPNLCRDPNATDVPTVSDDPSCSVSQELIHSESRGELQRGRGDLSSSEHSRPRLRRDTLYATKRLTNSGTSNLDRTHIIRPNSEIDFRRAAATAAKKRQSAGRRISGGASPPRDSSLHKSLIPSTTNHNSSAELSELSPPRLPRSKTSGTNLCCSEGRKRSFNNLNLVGVYSNGGSSSISPMRTVADFRRSLKNNNGGRHDIDDLVVKMTRGIKSSGLQTKRGNATWN